MSGSNKMKEMVGGCCVCSDERGWTENPLVYCDGHGCNVAVHQACYGIVQVPTGPWFCRKCESQERAARVKCELCPLKDGALKRTDSGGWCHVVCALFIPEAWFANVQTMEPIMLKNVPPDRFNRHCYICEENNREVSKATAGACMQCNRNGCRQNFHVTCAQAQGLLCEEAGNYGDNVKYCGYCSYHFKKLKKDANIKTIPAFKPIPADNATPDSTPEKSYNEPKVNISAEHKNRESFAARQLSGLIYMGPETRRSRESTPNNVLKSVLGLNDIDTKPAMEISRSDKAFKTTPQEKSSKGTQQEKPSKATQQEKPSKSIPPDKGKPSATDKDNKSSDKTTTSSSNDTKVISESKFSRAESPGKLFSPLPEGQVLTTVPATTQVAFPTSLDGIISSMVNSSNAPPTPTDSDTSSLPTVRSRRSRAGSLDKEKKKRGKAAVQPTRNSRASRTSVSEDNSEVSPPTSKRSKQKPESIHTTSVSSVTTSTTSTSSNSTLAPQNLSVFGGEPTFPNPIMKTSFTQADTGSLPVLPPPVSDTLQQGNGSMATSLTLSTGIATVSSTPTTSATGLKISNGLSLGPPSLGPPILGPPSLGTPLLGPPNPFSSSTPFTATSQISKSNSETPTSMEELLEMQWAQGSNFLMEQGQHFDIASLLNCLHKLKSENKKLEEYVRNLLSRRDHLLTVNARLSLPFGSSHISASAPSDNGDGQSTRPVTPSKLRIPNGTESVSDDNSDDSQINVVDTPTDRGPTESPIPSNTHLSSESIRHQLFTSQKHPDQFINPSSQITTSSNKESTAQDKT